LFGWADNLFGFAGLIARAAAPYSWFTRFAAGANAEKEPHMQANVSESDSTGIISRADLQRKMGERPSAGRRLVLLEALGPMHYDRGHLPGAIQLSYEQTRELAPQLLPSRDDDIVVYCASTTCRNSHVAAGVLRTMGYRRVSVYAGGKQDWQEAGLPLEVSGS
jgi:rhodanese-related sulfurtransferase